MRGISRLALAGGFAVIVAGAAAGPAAADVLGVDFSSTQSCAGFAAPYCIATDWPTLENMGYEFQANNAATVSALGAYDGGSLGGFVTVNNQIVPVTVGLWDVTTQTLVASATVSSGSNQVTSWAFTSIAPVTLTAGDFYVVGASGGLAYVADGVGISVDPAITYLAADDTNLSGLTLDANGLPSVADLSLDPADSDAAGLFGANIELASVPEPMSLALFGAALAGFGLVRRRKSA